MKNQIQIGTTWHWEHWYNGVLLKKWTDHNLCTTEGRNHILDSVFAADTQITSWYVVPYENDHSPAAGDTYAAPGFTECEDYDETTRPLLQPGAAAAGVIDNSANKASMTFNAVKTIYGAALVGGGSAPSTKGDAAGGGVLFCEAAFAGGAEAVIDGSVIKVTVEITCSDIG